MTTDARPVVYDAGRLLTRVLVASPRANVRSALAVALTEAGFTVAIAATPEELAERISQVAPSAVLVDAHAESPPLTAVRQATSAPVVALVPAAPPDRALAAFAQGADDCISLRGDFHADATFRAELVWRLVRALRRDGAPPESGFVLGGPEGLRLRPHAHEVAVGDRAVDLTPHEFALLKLLLERRGEVVTPDQIAALEWGPPVADPRGFVQAHVSRVRAKLRDAGAYDVISTVRGVGYVVR